MMPTRWRAAALRFFATGVAIALLAGPAAMALPFAPDAGTHHHGGHHEPGDHPDQGKRPADCCNSCATHCPAHQGISKADVVQSATPAVTRAHGFDPLARAFPHRTQLRLPPSQAPPSHLG